MTRDTEPADGAAVPPHDGGSASSQEPTALAPVADLEIDAKGLACPLPILRAKKALATLVSGQVLKVITTDRNAIRDFQAFARQTGNTLLLQEENAGQGVHFLRRR